MSRNFCFFTSKDLGCKGFYFSLFSLSLFFFIPDELIYTFHHDGQSWQDAQRICMQEGSNLAMPKTISAVEYIRSTWGNNGSFWIGAHDDHDDPSQEGRFVYVDGDSLLQYPTFWAQGEPSNSRNDEDCVGHWASHGWNDFNCDSKLKYLCEKTIQQN